MHQEQAIRAYNQAYKSGMKSYTKNISDGENGNLPVLEAVLKHTDIVSEINLGIIDIPLEKIKGTYTRGRSLSFAANFMPIMKTDTEFHIKWVNVALAHNNEGLRDAIKVYEYLNWFYVVEGNKRVSVLKHFGVYSFSAQVTRLIPKYDENDPTIRLYYEFLDFYNKTKINTIWFTKENSFNTLYNYMTFYTPENDIHDNRYIAFEKDVYVPFQTQYHKNDGDSLTITTGDALLEYIKLYGTPTTKEFLEENKIDRRIQNLIKELSTLEEENEIEIDTEATEDKSIVSSITSLIRPKHKLEVAFAYAKTISTSNWTYSHELGRRYVSEKLSDIVSTKAFDKIPENKKSYESLHKLANEGYDVIFATSPAFITESLKVALDHPDTLFFNCTQSYSFKHVTTYFGRIYEARFLAGVIAGSMTKSNILGYVATFAVPEVISGINAFALGAKMVNPRVVVNVEWINEWDSYERTIEKSLILSSRGADIMAHHNNFGRKGTSKAYGLYTLQCEGDQLCKPDSYLASPIWNWGVFYERILNSVYSGSLKAVSNLTGIKRQVNFWWGMDTGVVDLIYSKRLIPNRTQILIEYMRQGIINGTISPFAGPIYDNEGKLRIEDGQNASNQEILSMDWFVNFVETEIHESGYKHPDTNLITGKIE